MPGFAGATADPALARLRRAETHADVGAVVCELREHSAHPLIQAAGCTTLQRLTVHERKRQRTAGSAGAIEAVVLALLNHGRDAGVQTAGCAALWSLSAEASNRLRAVAAGGVEAAVAALRAHASNAEVREHAHRALHALCSPQATSWADIVDGVTHGAAELTKAEQLAREHTFGMLAHACTIVAGMLVASAGVAGQGWEHVHASCAQLIGRSHFDALAGEPHADGAPLYT